SNHRDRCGQSGSDHPRRHRLSLGQGLYPHFPSPLPFRVFRDHNSRSEHRSFWTPTGGGIGKPISRSPLFPFVPSFLCCSTLNPQPSTNLALGTWGFPTLCVNFPFHLLLPPTSQK